MITLRRLPVYALMDTVRPVTLRDIKAFVLLGPNNRPSWGTPGRTGLLTQINKEQGTAVVAADVTVVSSVLSGDPTFNSVATVTAVSPGKYSGSFTFRYMRFALAEAFQGKTLDLPPGTFTDVHSALAAINTKFSVALETTEIVNATLPSGYTSIKLTVASNSPYYLPGSEVTLGTP